MPFSGGKRFFRSVPDDCFGPNHVVNVVAASLTAGAVSINNLQYLKKTDQVTKWIPWSTVQSEGPETVVLCCSCCCFVVVFSR